MVKLWNSIPNNKYTALYHLLFFFIFMLVIVTPGTGSVILRLEMKHIPLESVTDKNLSDLTENKA